MKKVKMIIGLALAMALLCHSTSAVYAVTHAADCQTSNYTVVCGRQVKVESIGAHEIYKVNTGSMVRCARTRVYCAHTINCANIDCGVVLESNVERVCRENHAYCGPITGLCQY